MKKVLLSSVAALAVFAAAPVFANNQGYVHTGSLDNKSEVQGKDFFLDDASKDFNSGLTPEAKKGLNNADADSTKAKFKAAGEEIKPKLDENGKAIPGEFVVSGKAKDAAKPAGKDAAKPAGKDAAKPAGKDAAKSSSAAGQKALPKTSAVK